MIALKNHRCCTMESWMVLVFSILQTIQASFIPHHNSGLTATTKATFLPSPFLPNTLRPHSLSSLSSLSSSSTPTHTPPSIEDEHDDDDDDSTPLLRCMTFPALTQETEPQLLSDFLMELGACSVSITDHDLGTSDESPIFREPSTSSSSSSTDAAVVWGDLAVGTNLWQRCDVQCHLPSTVDPRRVADQIRWGFGLESMPRYTVDDVPDRDWVVYVQSQWKPAVVEGFVLCFPWHTEDDVREALDKASRANDDDGGGGDGGFTTVDDDGRRLRLEGGVAFGTGEHPTTQLCLRYVNNLLSTINNDNDNDNDDAIRLFLDYGSGSGVLGMAASACSPNVRSIGIEIDPDAICVADRNARTNDLRMESYLPRTMGTDDEANSLVMKALYRTRDEQNLNRSTIRVLPEELDQEGLYDACAANILAGPLIGLVETIARLVKSGGRIGLSGILEYQAEDVMEAYGEFFDDVEVEEEREGWVLITGTRK